MVLDCVCMYAFIHRDTKTSEATPPIHICVPAQATAYAFGSDRWLQLGLGEAWAERGGPICRNPQVCM